MSQIFSLLRRSVCQRSLLSSTMEEPLLDATQASYLSEQCIQVDREDREIGPISKRDAHNYARIASEDCLHRAFSVLVFNSRGQMLLQRRAEAKITFPGLWTNACCSHPLWREEERARPDGVLVAARRKLAHELGYSAGALAEARLQPLTRILYKAQCPPPRHLWGEHELDHVLLLSSFDAEPVPNANEVAEVAFVDEEELRRRLEEDESAFTPWFRLLAARFLKEWWPKVGGREPKDDGRIHDFLE